MDMRIPLDDAIDLSAAAVALTRLARSLGEDQEGGFLAYLVSSFTLHLV